MQPTTGCLALILVALLPCFTNAISPDQIKHAVSYAQLAPFNNQWNITISFGKVGSSVFTPHMCNSTMFGAPCNQPPLMQNKNDVLKITYTPRNTSAPFKTLRNGVPDRTVVKICYTVTSWTDRAWRKKNKAYPHYGQDCPIELGVTPFNPAGGEETVNLEHDLPEEEALPNAIFYASVCTLCNMPPGDIAGKNNFCQCDKTENKNTFETKRINGATAGHIAAAVVLAVTSPAIFFTLYMADAVHYKRTGRALKLWGFADKAF